MKIALLLLMISLLLVLIGGFAFGAARGRVKGAHPVGKNLAWIEKSEHPHHFWGYAVLHIVLYTLLAWFVFGIWNSPAF